MANVKIIKNYSGAYHFVLKRQMEEVLQGKADHLTLYKKIGNIIKRVCNETEAELDENEVIIEVSD